MAPLVLVARPRAFSRRNSVRKEEIVNRSVERIRIPVADTEPGRLVVTGFRHPKRGPVASPAADVVAASLRRAGQPAAVHHGELVRGTGGVLVAASYVDRSHLALGIGVVARRDDAAGLAVADEVIESWCATWRTRRVVLGSAETCGRTGCPHVGMATAEVRRILIQGDLPIVIGTGPAPHGVPTVSTVDDVARLTANPDRLAYVVWPGVVVEDAVPVIAALRRRYPRIRSGHPDAFCYAASDRRHANRLVAASCGAVLVVGTAVPNELRAGEVAIHELAEAADLRPEWLLGHESVGVVGPPGPVDDLVRILSGLGPLSVVRRQVSTLASSHHVITRQNVG